jgi:hypothetical protein
MTQNPTKSTSLAQQLGNPQYQLFAQALSNWSTPPFATASSRAQLVASFTTNTFEQSANTQLPGLGNALYFTREASSLKTLTALQADSNLLQVAVVATSVPFDDFGALSFSQQSNLLQKSIKVTKLQSQSYVKQLAEQYLIQQQGSVNSTPAPGSIASLFSDGTQSDSDTLLSILEPSAADALSNQNANGNASPALSLLA